MNTCKGCPVTWDGATLCHCGACHETFTAQTAFDRHRVAMGKGSKANVCVQPHVRGLVYSTRTNGLKVWGSA